MAEAARQGDKLNVFISYSRDDLAFADQLDAALGVAGFGAIIDRQGILAGEDWQTRLGALIRDSDTVVFVLSPSSARSKTCAWEVEEAVRLGKRILPVICRSLEDASPPPQLAKLNYTYFYAEPRFPGCGFGVGLVGLVSALNTDLDWLREHTRYLQRATEWDAGGRPANRLLSGPDIATAKAWAARRPKNAPEPTPLQLDFVKASEAEATRQQTPRRSVCRKWLRRKPSVARRSPKERRRRSKKPTLERARRRRNGARPSKRSAWCGERGWDWRPLWFLPSSLEGSPFSRPKSATEQLQESRANEERDLAEQAKRAADEQRDLAQKATVTANKQRDIAEKATQEANQARDRALQQESRALATLARQASEAGDQPTAMLLALEALPDPGFGGARPLSSEAAAALHQAWLRNRETTLLSGHRDAVRSASFSADGTHVVTASDDGTARVWDLRVKRPSFVVLEGHKDRVNSASFIADGTHVVTVSDDGTARVWDLRGERPSFVALGGHQDRVNAASFSADGTHVVTASQDMTARVWDLREKQPSFVALEGHQGSVGRRSAPTERRWSRCLATRRRGCGICAPNRRVSWLSRGIRVRSSQRRSASTERMWSRRLRT
jgi:hypothetical protein